MSVYTLDFTPSAMYDILTDRNLVNFVNQFAFVNGHFSQRRGEIIFIGHAEVPSWKTIDWENINCRSVDDAIKTSPCTVGRSEKIFFRYAESLGDYIDQLFMHEISRSVHIRLFTEVFKLFGTSDFVNHNTDIAILHFKTSEI